MKTHPACFVKVGEIIIQLLNVHFDSCKIIGDVVTADLRPQLSLENLVGKKYNQLCKIKKKHGEITVKSEF